MTLIKITECGGGVNKDLLSSELKPGQWSDCLNMRFRNGFAEKRKGIQAAFTTPPVIPYWLGTYNTATARFLVEAGLAKVYVDDGTTQTEITGAAPTGAIDDRWTGGVLNGVLIMNNGVDDASYWNGDTATNLATLSGWTAGWKSDVIRPFKNYLIALGNTRGGSKQVHNVGWSEAADPGTIPGSWTASSTNDAGDVDLAETPGQLVDCLPWGDVNIIYKQDARYAQSFIEGNAVFRFQRMSGDDGLLARGCVVNTPKGQVFLSNGDVKIHSGGEAVSIADGVIRRWIFNTMDSVYASRSFLAVNAQKNEVWVCFPSTGQTSCDTIAVWNWDSGTWGIFTASGLTYGTSGLVASALSSGTIDSDTDPIDTDATTNDENEYSQNEQRLILSTITPRIGLAETGTTDFGSAITWLLEKTGISLGDSDTIKNLSSSRPQFNGTAGTVVSVYHGSSMTADADPSYGSAITFTQGTTNWADGFAPGGRYMAYKLTGTDYPIVSLRSYDLDYTTRGRF